VLVCPLGQDKRTATVAVIVVFGRAARWPGAVLIVSRVCAFNRHSNQSLCLCTRSHVDCPNACIKSLAVTRELSPNTDCYSSDYVSFIWRHSLLRQSIFRPIIKLLALWASAGRPSEDQAALQGRDPGDSVKLASLVAKRVRMHVTRLTMRRMRQRRSIVYSHNYRATLLFPVRC